MHVKIEALIETGHITKEWAYFNGMDNAWLYFINIIIPFLANVKALWYPSIEEKQFFRAFNMCPPNKLKCIILGQD